MRVREPVLGIHDPAPPEGRVTIELLDERGLKVLKRERANNAIMNHWTEVCKRQVRGDVVASASGQVGSNYQGTNGYGFHGGQTLTSETDVMITDQSASGADAWWKRGILQSNPLWGHPYFFQQTMRNLLLSDSTEAVDADEWAFPGNLTAFCYLREAYTPAANLKRATLMLASSFRTPTALRYQAEWGTAYGNGTINSVGIGSAIFTIQAAGSGAFVQPSPYPSLVQALNFGDASTSPSTIAACAFRPGATNGFFGINAVPATSTEVGCMSGHRVSNSELWVLISGTAGNNLTKMDLSAVSVRPFSVAASSAANGLSVTGPTMTTIGAATNRCGVTVIGSDLWLAYGTTLKRCVKPTNTTLSVTNTYAPVGVGTLIDITTDGTSLYWLDATKVWVINATTGAVSSSWNHNLTGNVLNISYMAAPASKPRLYITQVTTTDVLQWNDLTGPTAHSPVMTYAFTVAGAGEISVGFNPIIYPSSIQYIKGGIVMPLSTDCKHFIAGGIYQPNGSANQHSIYGPSHLSRTVLGSPIVKTSANGLRCVYEYGF